MKDTYHEWVRKKKNSSVYVCKHCEFEVVSPNDKPYSSDVVYVFNAFTDFMGSGTRTNIPGKCDATNIVLVMNE